MKCGKTCILVAALLMVVLSSCSGHSSDGELEKRFAGNREKFDTLVRMFTSDRAGGYLTVAPQYAPKGENVSEDRLNEYSAIMKELGLVQIRSLNGNGIGLAASEIGFPIQTSSKGYLFSKEPPEPLVADLDRYEATQSRSQVFAYKRLGEDWYLYFMLL